MYKEFYHLKENPFNVTPDPDFFFSSTRHTDALSNLIYGIQQRKGILLITGEVGTGKTTICRTLLRNYRSRLENDVKTAMVLNPICSDLQLLQFILKDLGIQGEFRNKFDLINALNEFLLRETDHGNNVVLIIDEAQNLEVEQLEQIRLLSNLETEKEKLLQIILVGQPELCEKLNLPSLRQLNQRITVRYHILPLERHEIQNYVKHRLMIASAENSVNGVHFTKDAIDTIYEYCKGTPRMINIVCDRALLAGYTLETFTIDEQIVSECVQEVGIKIYDKDQKHLNNQQVFGPGQKTPDLVKNSRGWYKNIFALLCVFFIIATLLYAFLPNLSDRLKSKKPDLVSQQNLPSQPDLSNQPSLPSGGNFVQSESDQSTINTENEEDKAEQHAKVYNFDKQESNKKAASGPKRETEENTVQAQANSVITYQKNQEIKQNKENVKLNTISEKDPKIEDGYEYTFKRYRETAELGNEQAQNALGIMYERGQGVKQDFKEASRWYRRAAEQGNIQAKNNLGFMYEKGHGVVQDYKEAVRWYQEAAIHGHSQAQVNLGFLYSKGHGVGQDYEESVRWYLRAAEQEHADAQNVLGSMYEKGYGVEQDYEEAIKWYHIAAEQGIVHAADALKRLEGKDVYKTY